MMRLILTLGMGFLFGAFLLTLVPRQDLPVTTDQMITANFIAHDLGYVTRWDGR